MYISGRVRAKNESNGKACNLNSTLRNLYPPGQPVDDAEVRARLCCAMHGGRGLGICYHLCGKRCVIRNVLGCQSSTVLHASMRPALLRSTPFSS